MLFPSGSGIYGIRNLLNGKSYVGSAIDLYNRWSVHRTRLKQGNHHNKHLQNAWNKYGEDAFVFEVLESCSGSVDDLECREQFWMDKLDSVRNGYNLAPTARSTLGIKHSEESRKRSSVSALRVGADPEERKRRSELAKRQHAEGKLGAATRKNIKRGFRYCEHCGERFWQKSGHRQRFCSTICSNEYGSKHRVSPMLGSSWSEETRAKIMATWTPERRAAVGKFLHGQREHKGDG
jgi:group I intron endonuclease